MGGLETPPPDTAPAAHAADTPPEGALARVVAVVRAASLDAVMERVVPRVPGGVVGVELVRGYGRQKGHLAFYESAGFEGGFLPKVRLEFHVPPTEVDGAVEAVCEGARTGRIGDGKIFVQLVEPLDAGADGAEAAS